MQLIKFEKLTHLVHCVSEIFALKHGNLQNTAKTGQKNGHKHHKKFQCKMHVTYCIIFEFRKLMYDHKYLPKNVWQNLRDLWRYRPSRGQNKNVKWTLELEVVFSLFWQKKTKYLAFSRFFISVAMDDAKSIFGAISYILVINILGKYQRHSSRASYLSKVGPGQCVAQQTCIKCYIWPCIDRCPN